MPVLKQISPPLVPFLPMAFPSTSRPSAKSKYAFPFKGVELNLAKIGMLLKGFLSSRLILYTSVGIQPTTTATYLNKLVRSAPLQPKDIPKDGGACAGAIFSPLIFGDRVYGDRPHRPLSHRLRSQTRSCTGSDA